MHGRMSSIHHLFRLRVLPHVWDKLGEVAKRETVRKNEFVSRSDIARVAIADWLNGYDAAERLGAMRPPGGETATGG